MKRIQCKSVMGVAAGFLVFAAMGGAFPALAQVVCGDIITQNTKLTEDLACSTNPALTVVGPANLNMKGFTVSCDVIANDGIVLDGGKGKLQNGTITGCRDGVVVAGTGSHHVSGVTSTENDVNGFFVSSDGNTFINNTGNNNDEDGFSIDSNDNQFVNNTGSGNEDGFDVDGGNRNRFVNNIGENNSSDGFDLDDGGEGNQYINNTANANEDCGFDIDGPGNQFSNNTANNNGTDGSGTGFSIDEANNELHNNTANNNAGDGIRLQENSDGVDVFKNVTLNNGESGIQLSDGAENNTVMKNTARGNTEFDLQDDNAGCDNNDWRKNRFDTSNDPGCID